MKDIVLRKRYKIVEYLGSGSFGDTYLAEDLDLPHKPKCVVKHLRPKTPEPEVLLVARRLFESEAEVLYRLGNLSNQIPKLFAHFEENGEFYLVQEFVDGHDLSAEIIPGKRWSEDEVVKLLAQTLEVLVVVHQQNIIHRDIKPQNLMRRREDGKIALIDFGAVKEIKGLAANTQGQITSTIVIGSNGYMPNEQANSKPKLCSDIYAVGVMGIQALTGKLPENFPEDPTSGEIVWQHEANVSPRLASVLTKMVRYNFSQRYQSAAEALQALTQPQPLPNSTPQPLGVNRKVLIGAGVGVGVLLGVGLLFMSFSPPQDTPELSQAVTESTPATPDVGKTVTESTPATPEVTQPFVDVQLVCPETPISPLPSTPSWKTSTAKYYGFPKVSQPPTGKGSMTYKDQKGGSVRYDGELKNGKFSGCGTFTFPNEDRYIGQFDDNNFQGTGKFIYKQGCQYVGDFKKNKFDGQGTFTSKDGSHYSGTWKNGKLEGNNKNFGSCW